jgi:hypothetical protein
VQSLARSIEEAALTSRTAEIRLAIWTVEMVLAVRMAEIKMLRWMVRLWVIRVRIHVSPPNLKE